MRLEHFHLRFVWCWRLLIIVMNKILSCLAHVAQLQSLIFFCKSLVLDQHSWFMANLFNSFQYIQRCDEFQALEIFTFLAQLSRTITNIVANITKSTNALTTESRSTEYSTTLIQFLSFLWKRKPPSLEKYLHHYYSTIINTLRSDCQGS